MSELIPSYSSDIAAAGNEVVQNKKEEAIFRSAEMSLIEMFIPYELARPIAYKLGDLGLVQFRDLNTKIRTFQRQFVDDIKKLDNVERQFQYFVTLLEKYEIQLSDYQFDHNIDEDNEDGQSEFKASIVPNAGDIDDLANSSTTLEDKLVDMVDGLKELETQKVELEQHRFVLHKGDEFFTQLGSNILGESGGVALGSGSRSSNFVVGCLPRDKVGIVEQILWRILRGNLYFHTTEIEEPIFDLKSDSFVYKNFFIVYSHGEGIQKRVNKIIESLDGSIYDVPADSGDRSSDLQKINTQLSDLYMLLDNTKSLMIQELTLLSTHLNQWYKIVVKEKQVFTIMNYWKYDSENSGSTLIAEGWLPSDEIDRLNDVLIGSVSSSSSSSSSHGVGISSVSSHNDNTSVDEHSHNGHQQNVIINVLETNKTPPTFHRTNKFTQAFQDICDCYGIAQYREVNAGLPTIVTFPFMFAIMFGDLGHGLIMFLAALTLVLNEGKINKMRRDEIFDMAFGGRYILLLMGLFSMYTGLLYNDIFSKSLTLFKTGWEWVPLNPGSNDNIYIGEMPLGNNIYPFGLDYIWHGTENGLLFSNSYKMKLSILMGFIHMTYSYFFALVNYLNFNSWIDIIGNFIPGLIFMQSIFGYLSLCIVYKWSKDWIKDGREAPGLLNMLINMFLSPGNIDAELYTGQSFVQIVLLLLALLCIPCLLLIKPLHFKFQENRTKKTPALPSTENDGEEEEEEEELLLDLEDSHVVESEDLEEEHGGHGEETFGDVMIHQVIHTIEFCLNCVSHTASYLRLWALSLAHAQLSEVLWTMTINIGFKSNSPFMIVILFALWFVLTVAVLVVMEGTSAMLHSLRLHWVESMSKFFVGEGLPYLPFKFEYEPLYY